MMNKKFVLISKCVTGSDNVDAEIVTLKKLKQMKLYTDIIIANSWEEFDKYDLCYIVIPYVEPIRKEVFSRESSCEQKRGI